MTTAVDNSDRMFTLLSDVHTDLQAPTDDGNTTVVKGSYLYYHYNCDGDQDKGWGCGYRTLQTICSWIRAEASSDLKQLPQVPSIAQIQQFLVDMDDKPLTFLGSRDWIGSFEACLILDHLYNVCSKIEHVSRGSELHKHVHTLVDHFTNFGSPIMMGGNVDCSSKGIMGIHTSPNGTYLLVVDPHFCDRTTSVAKLQSQSWVKWQSLDNFVDSSFYNFCIPQVAHKK